MGKSKLWTPQEFKILEKYIKERDWKKASKALDRSENACRLAYYAHFKTTEKNSNNSYENTKKILYGNISKNPGNLQEAFRLTAKQTGVSFHTIMDGYYSKTHYLSRHKNQACFAIISNKGAKANAKIFVSSTPAKSLIVKIKEWIKKYYKYFQKG